MSDADPRWFSNMPSAENALELASRRPWVLVVDLDDPASAPHIDLDPTARDLADGGKPLAGPRAYFFKRRSLLRHLVSRWLRCPASSVVIGHDDSGAPRVIAPDASIFVSVAARGSIAAVAASATPIGVDLEPSEPPAEPVWDVLHRNERTAVEAEWSVGRDDLFRDIWIVKEAYLKALGTGLTRDPASIAVHFKGAMNFRIGDKGASSPALGYIVDRSVGWARLRLAVATLDS